MKPLVIYHDHCTDGFGAAFAAWCKLGDSAEYLPMSYGSVHPADFIDLVQDRDLYVLDFSFPKPIMALAISHAAKLVWLDHHKSAFEMWLPGAFKKGDKFKEVARPHELYIYLDDNKSGAMLAWEYFHPDKDVPDLINYIDDRDRWVFNYGAASKALHAGLQTLQPWKFREWADLVPAMGGSTWALNEVTDAGYTILNIYDKQIADRVKVAEKCCVNTWSPQHGPDIADVVPPSWSNGYLRKFAGLAVNSPIHQSEIGNELAKASGTYGLVWYYDSATKRANVSLRSIGDYDVSAIAKTFGGGGHRNAAGFNIDMSTLLGFL